MDGLFTSYKHGNRPYLKNFHWVNQAKNPFELGIKINKKRDVYIAVPGRIQISTSLGLLFPEHTPQGLANGIHVFNHHRLVRFNRYLIPLDGLQGDTILGDIFCNAGKGHDLIGA